MNPVAISLGPLQVHWYGIILATAVISGLMLTIREGKRFGLEPDFFTGMLLVCLPSAIVGARVYYVIFKWEDYRDNLLEVFMIWQGGIAIYGALIGGVIAAFFYFRSKGYNFWRIADICAPGLIIGQMIGRWGNFVNQEAHGGPVSESFLRETLNLPDFIVNGMNIEGVYYHPTFLYESVWSLTGFLLLLWLRRRPFVGAGELLLGYFIWYSIGRFFVEGMRTDSLAFSGPTWLNELMSLLWSPMMLVFDEGMMAYGNVRISQLLALLIIIATVLLILYRRNKVIPAIRYSDPIISEK